MDQRTVTSFGTPSLNAPFSEDTSAQDLIVDGLIMVGLANNQFRDSLNAIKQTGSMQQLVESFEHSRPAQTALKELQSGLQEIATPKASSKTESRFNELQLRRRETLQEALDHQILHSLLPEGSEPLAYLEELLLSAADIAHQKGLTLVEQQHDRIGLVQAGKLAGALPAVSLKQHFKDADFFNSLATTLKKVWPDL